MPSSSRPHASRLPGALAFVLAGVVFALGLLSASPATHARLHAHDAHQDAHGHDHAIAHDDAGCAVSLFSQGVVTPLEFPCVEAPPAACVATLEPSRAARHLVSPGHLRPPGRGPPRLG